jgi:hypothetical protein
MGLAAGTEKRDQTFARGGGTLTAREVARGVFVFELSGYFDDVKITEDFDAWFAKRMRPGQRVTVFWDTEKTSGYKTECRQSLETWQKKHQPTMVSSTVFVRSKLMAMAISITNLTLGSFHKSTADRAKFEAMIRAASRGAEVPAEHQPQL